MADQHLFATHPLGPGDRRAFRRGGQARQARGHARAVLDLFGSEPTPGLAARVRGAGVRGDLPVVNHTSDQHPWFQKARKSRGDRHREYYVWRDERPEDGPKGLAFPGVETSNWEWDEEAGQYYLHRFYSHQPDLNIEHPHVRDEIDKIMGFWLELGVSGFRTDAVPFLLETEGIDNETDADPHEYLRGFRSFLSRRRGDAIMLGEVNREPEGQRRFFGDEDGDELHMFFNFVVNQRMYLALARQDATPLKEALRSLPEIPEANQWANFVRNHDELTLDKLSDEERDEVFAGASDPTKSTSSTAAGSGAACPPCSTGTAAASRWPTA